MFSLDGGLPEVRNNILSSKIKLDDLADSQ